MALNNVVATVEFRAIDLVSAVAAKVRAEVAAASDAMAASNAKVATSGDAVVASEGRVASTTRVVKTETKAAAVENIGFAESFRVAGERMTLYDASLLKSKGNIALFAAVLGGSAMKAALDFGEHIQIIGGNTGMTTQQVSAMREEVLKLGAQGPIALNDIADGFEKASNLMYQGKDRTELVTTAWKAAIATGGSVSDIVNLLGTSMRNAHEPMANAAADMGMFMRGAAEGNIRLPDMANNFQKVSVLAGSMHMPLADAIASYATLTRATHDGALAQTEWVGMATHIMNVTGPQLKLMKELQQTTGVDLPKAFAATANGQMSLIDLMALSVKATQGNSSELFKLFGGIRGGQAALTLAQQHWGDYIKTQNDVRQSTSLLDDQFKNMMKDPSAQLKTVKNDLEILAINIGDKLIPVLVKVVNNFLGFAQAVGDLLGPIGNLLDHFPGLEHGLGAILALVVELGIAWKAWNVAMAATDWLLGGGLLTKLGLEATAIKGVGEAAGIAAPKVNALRDAEARPMGPHPPSGLGSPDPVTRRIAQYGANEYTAPTSRGTAGAVGEGVGSLAGPLSAAYTAYQMFTWKPNTDNQKTLDFLKQHTDLMTKDQKATLDLFAAQQKFNAPDPYGLTTQTRALNTEIPKLVQHVNDEIAAHNKAAAAANKHATALDAIKAAGGAGQQYHAAQAAGASAAASTAATDPQKQYQDAMTALTKAEYAQAAAIVNGTATAGSFNAGLADAAKTANKWKEAVAAVQQQDAAFDPQQAYQAATKAFTDVQYQMAYDQVQGIKVSQDLQAEYKKDKAVVDKWTQALDASGAKHTKVTYDATAEIQKHQKTFTDAQDQAALDVMKLGYVSTGTSTKLEASGQWLDKFGAALDAIQHPTETKQAANTAVITELQHQSALIGLNNNLSATARAAQQAQLQVQVDSKQVALDQLKVLDLIAQHAPKSQVDAAQNQVATDQNKGIEDAIAAQNAAAAAALHVQDQQLQINEAGFSAQIALLQHQSTMAQMQVGLTADQKNAMSLAYQVQIDQRQIALDQLKLQQAVLTKDKVAIAQARNQVSADVYKYQEDSAAKSQTDSFVKVDAIVNRILGKEAGVTHGIAQTQHTSNMVALNVNLSPADKAVQQAQLQVQIDSKQIHLDQLKLAALKADPRSSKAEIIAAQQKVNDDRNKQIEDQKALSNAQAAAKTSAALTATASQARQAFIDGTGSIQAYVTAQKAATAATNAATLKSITADEATGQWINAAQQARQMYVEGKMSLADYIAIQRKGTAQQDAQTAREEKASAALGDWQTALQTATTMYQKGTMTMAAFINVMTHAIANQDKINKKMLRADEGAGDWQAALPLATELYNRGKINLTEFVNVSKHATEQQQSYNAKQEKADEALGHWTDAATLARQAYMDGTMTLDQYVAVQKRANQQADEQAQKAVKADTATGDWTQAVTDATPLYHKGVMSFTEFVGILTNANAAAKANADSDWKASYAAANLADKHNMLAARYAGLVSQQSTIAGAQSSVDSARLGVIAAEGAATVQQLQNIAAEIGDLSAIDQAVAGIHTAGFNEQLAAINDQTAIMQAQGQYTLTTNAQLAVIKQDQLSGNTQKLAQDRALLSAMQKAGQDQINIARVTAQMDHAVGEAQLRVAQLQAKMAVDKLHVDQANQTAQGKIAIDNLAVAKDAVKIALDQQKIAIDQLTALGDISTALNGDDAKYGAMIKGDLATLSGDQSQSATDQGTLAGDTVSANTIAANGGNLLAGDQSGINSAQSDATAIQQNYQLQLAMLNQQKAGDDLIVQELQQANSLAQTQIQQQSFQIDTFKEMVALLGQKVEWGNSPAGDSFLHMINNFGIHSQAS